MSNPILNSRASFASLVQAEQTFIEELPDILGTATVMVEGVEMNKDQIVALVNSHLASINALVKSKPQQHALVLSQSGLREQVRTATQAVKALVEGKYGPASSQLSTLGLADAPRKAPSPETRVLANEKSRATRQARGTKGKRQRAAIHGTVPTAPPVSPTDKPGTGSK
jgi:hypothetical protein